MNNKVLAGAVVAFLLLGGALGYAFGLHSSLSQAVTLAGAAVQKNVGPTHYTSEAFLQGFTSGNRDALFVTNNGALTQGGTVVSTSTSGTLFGTLSMAQMKANRTIVLTPNIVSASTTLPTAALYAAEYPVAGQTNRWLLVNGTSTAARTVGIVAGSSMDLDSNTFANVQIQPNGSAELLCLTISASSVRCRVNVLVAAD